MKKAYLFLSAIGMAGFLLFAAPLVFGGILDVGNMTGMVLFSALVFYSFNADKVNIFIVNFRKKKIGRTVLCAVLAVTVLIASTACVLTGLMIKAVYNKPQGNETAVVLGCRVYGEEASLALKERLDAAYEYLCDNPETVCVVSGGKGSDEAISEAECMYRYLTEKGIAPERIYKEDKSTSTRENILFSKKIIEENGLNPHLAIVTNEFHIYRACHIAEKLGLECSAVAARTAFWLFPTYYVREMYGILYEWVF